ncbi:DUF4214 domain-containing protein [Pseudoduganella armeniaca]|uniref:DUF4214 domain-containing protein n=1 Tax=Pseudoduganella armeniaca TaxID=2072590 RepID=A0A2R4CE63_9BURK|nr:DUF4214 domain-containing protein [Pseudoduganella armeniaca]AVR97924.1 hypothetical protein C9I28_21480 [Pseudoduganella armeniaca]
MPTKFDFSSLVSSTGNPDNEQSRSAYQTVDGHTLELTGDRGGWAVVDENAYANMDVAVLHGAALFNGLGTAATTLRLSLDPGTMFDLTSLNLWDQNMAAGLQFRLTTSKGSVDTAPTDAQGGVAFQSYSPLLQGVSWVDISMTYPEQPFSPALDDIVLSNISFVPRFSAFDFTLPVQRNSEAVDIASLLRVTDVDSGQTLTWTQASGPSHGTLVMSNATAAAGDHDIAPGGTLTYQPAAGYAGMDSFTIRVSDGIASTTQLVTVKVAPEQPGVPELDPADDTGAPGDNVTAANAMTFSGTSGAGDNSSSVRVFIDTDRDRVFDAGEANGTATVADGSWRVEHLDTSSLASGTYDVRAIVTSASGNVSSTASEALSIRIDHTPPALTAGAIALSADSGNSASDGITNSAAQTITAQLSAPLEAGDKLLGSVDGGRSWTDLTDKVAGTTLTWTGATLVDGGGIALRVDDETGNRGVTATRAYTLDTLAPSQGMASIALAADTGASATDLVTNVATQIISGTLSAATTFGDIVEVSLDDGAHWQPAQNFTGTSMWSLTGQTLPASGTLQVRVSDTASNHGPATALAYVVDTGAPTAALPAGAELVAPSGTTFTFTVTYGDAGAGIDAATFGTGNVTVRDPHGNLLTVTGCAASGNAATYTVQAPGGSWDGDDAGAYTIGIGAQRVRDVAGNAVAAATATLDVTFSTAPKVTGLALGADTGTSVTDFVTKERTQTIEATLSHALAAGDKVSGSLDNGATWTDITASVEGTAVRWQGVTLADAGTIVIKATDSAGQDSQSASHAFQLITTAPTVAAADIAFVADTGASANDFITRTATQNMGGTLDGVLAAGQFVEVSMDGGAHWVNAAGSAGTWTLHDQVLAGSGIVQVRVSDVAGNHGAVLERHYTIDGEAPLAARPVRADVLDPSGAFTFAVAYTDAGGAGLDPATFGTGNVTVRGAHGALTVSGCTVANGTVTYTVDAPAGGWTAAELGDYTIGIAGTVRDLAGNAVAANANALTFHVGVRPSATITVADTALAAGETTTVTIAFAQAGVRGLDLADLAVAHGTLSGLTSAGDGRTWTATLTPAAGTWADGNTVTLDLGGVMSADGTVVAGSVRSNAYAVQTGTPPQPATNATMDGVPVLALTGTDAATGLAVRTITVQPVAAGRAPGDLADIVLNAAAGSQKASLSVGLPVGAALQLTGPTALLTHEQALLDLAHRLGTQAADAGKAFLAGLATSVPVQTATLVPIASSGTVPLTIGAGGEAASAIVLDARQLAAGATVVLDDVDFAAVVGQATLRGGAGNNYVVGDDARQNIYLGAGDDVLLGGGGDDVVGSAGGDDRLDGGAGNDVTIGGIGNDSLAGGSGDDVLQGGRSDRGAWTFALDGRGMLSARHETATFAPGQYENVTLAELDQAGAELGFLHASAKALTDIALLYQAAFGRAPDLAGLNFYLQGAGDPVSIARGFTTSTEWRETGVERLDNAAFVRQMYEQVLGRKPDAEGFAFWTAQLDGVNGRFATRGEVLAGFALSDEARALHKDGLVIGATGVTQEGGWIAGSGNDRLTGGAGNDVLIGGDGTDTAVFEGKRADAKVTLDADGAVHVVTATGTDTLRSIEAGAFADGVVDLRFTQASAKTLANVGLMYQAVLDRAGDVDGFAFWAAQEVPLGQLAVGFAGSTEFQARYGATDDAGFVRALYANSGLATTAAGGSAAWVEYLQTHSRAELVGAWVAQDAVHDAQFATAGLWLV